MSILKKCWFYVLIVGVLVGLGPSLTVSAQQRGPERAAEKRRYPDGKRVPHAKYKKIKEKIRLDLDREDLEKPETVGKGVARKLAERLPPGLTLREGIAGRVMKDLPRREPKGPEAEMLEEEPLPEEPPRTDKWFVLHPVEFEGVPVARSSDVLTIVGADGQILYTRERNIPKEVNATRSNVRESRATAVGLEHAAEEFGGTFKVVGEPQLEIWVDEDQMGHLAWTFIVETDSMEEPESRRYWVSAVGRAEVLDWESQVYHTHFGTVTGTLWTESPYGPRQSRPLQDLRVFRSGGGGSSAVTAKDGRYAFTFGGGGATINARLRGPNCVVSNQAGADFARSRSGGTVAPMDINFGATGQYQTAEVSAFFWTNETYHLAREVLDPIPGSPWANLSTRVNINNSCNAYWNGSSINFFRAGSGCPNTAYVDVVAHEYGHGIDHWLGGILDGGYSEGFSDAIALLVTRQSCLGRDFFGSGTCLRPATDVDLWPPGSSEGVHSQGKRYAQFTWRLIQELKASYSEEEAFLITRRLVLAAAAGNPTDIPDAVYLSFLADDTDGNLGNGTPHCYELAAAADSRNLPNPGCPLPGRGFAWANSPTAASYSPNLTYSYNSSGGPINIVRSGVGSYRVRFNGLGGHGKSGGHVQVTAHGSNSVMCKAWGWNSASPNYYVWVRCFNASGNLIDSRYNVLVTWR